MSDHAKEEDLVCGICDVHGEHEITEARGVRRTDEGRGLVDRNKK